MPKLFKLVAVLGLSAILFSNCGGVGGTASAYCNKLKECNLLAGMSLSECIERNTKDLENLTSTEREDVIKKVNQCLEFKSCGNFVSCIRG